MATGMIKRGSGSAYTRLMRRIRVKAIRAKTKICTVCGVKHASALPHTRPQSEAGK